MVVLKVGIRADTLQGFIADLSRNRVMAWVRAGARGGVGFLEHCNHIVESTIRLIFPPQEQPFPQAPESSTMHGEAVLLVFS